MEKQLLEVNSFNKDNIAKNSRLIRAEWSNSIKTGVQAMNYIIGKMHEKLIFDIFHIIPYYQMKKKQEQFKKRFNSWN